MTSPSPAPRANQVADVPSALIALIATVGLFAGCQTIGPAARTGGVLGGATGTLIGAVAGAPSDKALEGAAIGAVTGAALGGTLGHQVDKEVEQQQWELDQARAVASSRAVTIEQVIGMSANGLDDIVIINQIQANGVLARPTTHQLLQLQSSGVSSAVIGALQTAPLVEQTIGPPPPVVIHQRHWVAPPDPYCYPPPYFIPCRPGPRYGFSFRF